MCTISTPEPAPPGLYFHARDYDTFPKPSNGKSVADVHAVRRSQMVNDAFTKLDRLRGALKQLRYMDETGHIGAVLPHLRQRIIDLQDQLDDVVGDVDAALCRYSSPDDDSEPAEATVPIQDHETFTPYWYAENLDEIPVKPEGQWAFTKPEPPSAPSPKDVVAEMNNATLAHRRSELAKQSQLRWSFGGAR